MADYGLTSKGPNIKRLDVILDEMQTALSERTGVNIKQNPQSLMNHLLTNIADRIAELWELGQNIYDSQYPSTAEGINLDYAAQYGGTTRENPAPSYYHILCTGIDGTTIPAGTLIASSTNPPTQLTLPSQKVISRSGFNVAILRLANAEDLSSPLTAALNGTPYSFTPDPEKTVTEALTGLAEAITDTAFTTEVNDEFLTIMAVDATSTNAMVLSSALTTETVGSVFTFATVDYGDILLPDGVITKIVKAVPGLNSVVNVGTYVAGQLEETDTAFRKSYVDKIFNRSSRMLESIRSAILANCQGVTSVAPYENDTDETDSMGRYPHSVEIVVDGGDASEIAQQIYETKAAGINTYGSVEVNITGSYGDDITIRFNRPTYVYCWFKVGITMSKSIALPTNYVDIVKETILEEMDSLDAGSDVVPYRAIASALYEAVPGIDYADITLASDYTETKPDDYTLRSITISARERAVTDETKIEVVIDG